MHPTSITQSDILTALDDDRRQHRAEKYARERSSRARRLEKLEKLRVAVKTMEQLVVALPLVDSVDQAWDDYLDDDVKRVRSLVRQLAPATDVIRALTTQRQQLQSLVAENAHAMRAVRAALNETCVDDWALDVQRWKALARVHFTPWTTERLAHELDAALQETHQYKFSTDKQSMGLCFMGWEDSNRILRNGTALQYSLQKTFHGHNVVEHVAFVKRAHTETPLYCKILLGGRGRGHLDVLQQISPNAAIVLTHERYEGADHTVHAITLVADVETEDGMIQYMRSIDEPEVMRALVSPTDLWINKFYWWQHEVLDPRQPWTSCDYRASLHGRLQGPNPAFLRMWLFEVLCSLIRAENLLMGSSLLTWE